MDIDLLSTMVKEVMMNHDSVTLPGLGSFMAELVPASFSDKGYTINPPYRRLYFIPHQGDDTLLADLYSTSNNVNIADATRILVEFLSEMKEVLVTRKIVVFPGLGRLRATRENHFFFVADEDLDIYPEGFGLEPVSLKTHEETPEEVQEAVSTLAQMLEPEPVPEPESEPVPVIPSEVEESPAPEQKPKRLPLFVRILIWILVAAVIACIALAVVGRVAPDWLDYYLYSPEELEILHSL
jgi:nucleoid DNA-binding protein